MTTKTTDTGRELRTKARSEEITSRLAKTGNVFNLQPPKSDDSRLGKIEQELADLREAMAEPTALVPVDGATSLDVRRDLDAMREEIAELREEVNARQLSVADADAMARALNTRVRGLIDDQITDALRALSLRVEKVETAGGGNYANEIESLGQIVAATGNIVRGLAKEAGEARQRDADRAAEIEEMRDDFVACLERIPAIFKRPAS